MKITIFWFAWSGTSTIWKLLAEQMNYNFMSSGNIMRSWAEDLGLTIYDFEDTVIKDDSNFDLKLDQKVANYWKDNSDFIFESRLAWHFIPDSIKIFLKCNTDERYRRIHKREKWSHEDIISKNEKRESDLVERYNNVYPHINFPPEETDFDIVIDATHITPEEIITLIWEKIKW